MKATESNSRQERNTEHAKEFKNWVKSKNVEVLTSLPGVDLKVGQKVTFINGYGVKFEGHTILGFHTPDKYGDCVYLDIDCYWFSVSPDRVIVEKNNHTEMNKKYSIYYSLLDNGLKFGFFCLTSDVDKVDDSLKETFVGYTSSQKEASRILKDQDVVNY